MSYENEYIPMNKWGKDHWSTLAYIETVMVDCGGFQVGRDPKMRSNRRHFRVMAELCPNPKRNDKKGSLAVIMQPEHATILNDKQQVSNHDDWCCMQDMAAAGLFDLDVDAIEPRTTLHLSTYGQNIVAALRNHKANGGSFSNFVVQNQPEITPGL